ncbi:hypothetical protein ABIB94_008410 [Bradyrhizobium sp. JR7.2]|nr:hypothetical protein [Bradyrhizobium sp.]
MRRIDLFEATMQGWSRLNPAQRERFFQAGLKAALRLDRLEFRAWLLRRVRTSPLSPPIDLARFTISDADIAHLLRTARNAPGSEAAAEPDRDEANGG